MIVQLVDIYYFNQVFLLSYYLDINTILLIIKLFFIYTSSKIADNPIIECIDDNINNIIGLFSHINILYVIYLLDNFAKFHFYFFINFILYVYLNNFYNVETYKQNMSKIIYLSLCLIYII